MPVLQSRNPGIRKRSFPGFNDDDDDDDDCSSSGLEVPNSNSLQRSNHG